MSRPSALAEATDARIAFTVADELSATEPPEARALARDEVRLLVAEPGGIHHLLFRDIDRVLRPGDLLVVNTSATVASATDGVRADGRSVVVHFSSPVDGDDPAWIVELRRPDGKGPVRDAAAGERIRLPGSASLTLLAPQAVRGNRLWHARVEADGGVADLLERWGRPITYGYRQGRWPLDAYQTVFAGEPGSAEMPSAARPFTDRLVTRLVSAGVLFAPVRLHTGVSSLEAGEFPPAERCRVSESTADLVNHVRAVGGRVVAVGTSATRALETVARDDGTVGAVEGWTDLVLGPDRRARIVDGLVTGWHSADASHLALLEAVAGRPLVEAAYAAALEAGYRWHEFGDSCLFLPHRHPDR
ncbi:MAG: S-adenosylmethionine:tRNA ribosyltransferase-isomerase [Nitriliruptorales bacterium]